MLLADSLQVGAQLNVRTFHKKNLGKHVSVLGSMETKSYVLILSEAWFKPSSYDFAQIGGYFAAYYVCC